MNKEAIKSSSGYSLGYDDGKDDGIAQGRREAADIFEWLLGYTDFRQREQGEGAYWWRKELRKRIDEAGIILGTASDEAPKAKE
jgi:hypothetical protein